MLRNASILLVALVSAFPLFGQVKTTVLSTQELANRSDAIVEAKFDTALGSAISREMTGSCG